MVDLGANLCLLCDKTFSRKGSLNRHIKDVHSVQPTILKCTNCEYLTKRKDNLKRHVEKCEKNPFYETAEERFKCSECSAEYKFKSSLNCHIKKHHSYRNPQKTLIHKRKCPICPFETSDYKLKSMYFHFDKAHNISLQWENHSFASFDEFYDWKSQLERFVGTSFVLRSKSKCTKVFNCRRCGVHKSVAKNKRRLKITGTCRINGFCPAYIKTSIRNDRIFASHQHVHVGHGHELKYQRLSIEDRNYLASKLAEKVPHHEILKEIRGSVSDNSELQRIHLITKKDLQNIERRLNLKQEAISHSFDPVTVESWEMDASQSLDKASYYYESKVQETENLPVVCQDDSNNIEMKKELLCLEMNKLSKTIKNKSTTSDQLDLILDTITPLNKTLEAMKTSKNPLQVTNKLNNLSTSLKTCEEVIWYPEEVPEEIPEVKLVNVMEQVALELEVGMDESNTKVEPAAGVNETLEALNTSKNSLQVIPRSKFLSSPLKTLAEMIWYPEKVPEEIPELKLGEDEVFLSDEVMEQVAMELVIGMDLKNEVEIETDLKTEVEIEMDIKTEVEVGMGLNSEVEIETTNSKTEVEPTAGDHIYCKLISEEIQ